MERRKKGWRGWYTVSEMNEKFVQENAKLINGTISTKYGVRIRFLVFNATAIISVKLQGPIY